MNRLALVFGIVCLLQGLSASPSPQFGLSVAIPSSGKLSDVQSSVQSITDDFVDYVFYTLDAGYTNYDNTMTAITDVNTDIGELLQPILDAYDTLLAANDGDLDAAFDPLFTAIDAAIDYFTSSDAIALAGQFTAAGYTNINDMLDDAADRIKIALDIFKTALTNVQSKLIAAKAANDGNAAVSPSLLRQHLTLADMYDLVLVANDLKAFLPLFLYIVSEVDERLEEGDDYMLELQDLIDNSGDISQDYQDALDEIISDIEDTVSNSFSESSTEYESLQTDIGNFDNLPSAAAFAAVDQTLGLFVTAFADATLSSDNMAMNDAFHEIGSELDTLINSMISSASVIDEELVQLLVDTLVGNLEYGEYCFNKYKDLVTNLLTRGADAGWLCVDKEIIRLDHLFDVVVMLMDMIAYDMAYLGDELYVCDMLSDSSTDMEDCATELNGYYVDLLSAVESKRDLVYDLAIAEAHASKNRLLICIELAHIDVSVSQAQDLMDGLSICAADGPTGSD